MWTSLNRTDLAQLGRIDDYVRLEEVRRGPHPSLDGSTLLIASDYSGEHRGAANSVYSFLVTDIDAWHDWEKRRVRLRRSIGHSRRFSFKDLGDSRKRDALPRLLDAADSLHGLSLTILIDRRVRTLFEPPTDVVHALPWNGPTREKALRVIHFAALIAACTGQRNQHILWVTDQDAIAEGDSRRWALAETFATALSSMTTTNFGHIRVATTENDRGDLSLEDLVAIPDMVAGAASEVWTKAGDSSTGRLLIPAPALSPKTHRLIYWFADYSSPLLRVAIRLKPVSTSDSRIAVQLLSVEREP
jgi:hypothetical protein